MDHIGIVAGYGRGDKRLVPETGQAVAFFVRNALFGLDSDLVATRSVL
tara:strand:+ start:508 stop:651 length:144 start_codon:yes stop_codon:yes gene_type:complete